MDSALGFPYVWKPFKLHIHERQEIKLGVLTQTLESTSQLIACPSEKLDHVKKEWPPWAWAIEATRDILLEAEKFTSFGGPLFIKGHSEDYPSLSDMPQKQS